MMKKLKLFSLALMALITTSLWADGSAYSFEDNSTSTAPKWVKGGGTCTIVTEEARTGSYSGKHVPGGSDKVAKLQELSVTFKGGKHTVHYIAYVKKNSTSDAVTLKKVGLYQGSTFAETSPDLALTTSWQRVTGKGIRTGNTSDYTNVEMRFTSTTSSHSVYVDDVIVYATETDEKTDLKKPGSATVTSHTTLELAWTSGTDASDANNGATGVQKTLIFKKTSGEASGLNLNDQGIYSLTSTEGPSTDQSGDWTLVAVVDPATESYTTSLTAGHHYAVVHRDLAYNYSTPTYTTITAPAPATNPVITAAVNEEGWGSVSPASITVTSGDELTISSNVITCGGKTLTATAADATAEYTYAFANWSGVTDGQSVTTNLTATANFTRTANKYALAWDKNAEDADNLEGEYTTGQTAYGTTIVKPNTPTRSGYLFTGWAESASGDVVDVPETMPAANKTYYAQWVIGYSITYNDNGKTSGDVPTDEDIYAAGTEVTVLGKNTLAKTNYEFMGWNTKADGTGTVYMKDEKYTMPAENATLYAMWGVKLSWVVQVNEEEETVTTSSTSSSYATAVANPTNLVLNGLTVTKSSKTSATNKISTTKEKSGYISATFAVQEGYEFIPTHMALKTTAITEAITIEVNVGDEVDTWAQPKSGSNPDLHVYKFADPEAITGSGTMKIYAYGGEDGTKGYRLGTPIDLYGKYALVDYDVTHSAASNGSYTIKVGDADAVSTNTTANFGQTVTLAASPADGYEFSGWTVSKAEGTVTVTNNQFTMPAEAVTVTATFTAIDYTITHTAASNGSYTIKVGDADAVSTNTTANYNQTVTLAASPSEGYRFNGWTVMNGETPVEVTENRFTMPAADVTVSAAFAQLFAITCLDAENGSVSAVAQAIEGEEVTITTSPEATYKLNTLKVLKASDDSDVTASVLAEKVLTMPAYAVKVVATFVKDSGTDLDNTAEEVKAVKRIENGQLFIEKDGKTYNVLGTVVK